MKKIFCFYLEGFRNLPAWGRNVWFIILLKLFIMFFIFKLFFFKDKLKNEFKTDKERAEYVTMQITNRN